MSENSEQNSQTDPLSQYLSDFGVSDYDKDKKKLTAALTNALDTRKFEIELYWKRATYFWTFIGVIFGGYALVFTKMESPGREDLLVNNGRKIGKTMFVCWKTKLLVH
ncbi:hypothetical protein KEF85_13820 [Methylomonas paludis]|uniref:Uncharacterized protein n=1 Tax=Methylomonas paludis TaxID=1173101 RepID=A0A975MM91_9GAMM|nr:hypothetical protein [Methylomonas paludis]QWF70402.1 hypothetical protein KEF85_13820 [Methylomonas paludis]